MWALSWVHQITMKWKWDYKLLLEALVVIRRLSEVCLEAWRGWSLKADAAGIWGSIWVTKDGQAGFTTME